MLQGKEPGSFIVRSSSKPNTMALSVRLPKSKGPYIEHYLIENLGNRKLHLEGSERFFSVIPMLICHYCQCLDELPVCLKLPEIVLNASRHQLNSLSLLSEKFWTTNFEEHTFSSSDDEQPIEQAVGKLARYDEQLNGRSEPNNNLADENSRNHHSLNSKKSFQSNKSSDRQSMDEDRRSIEAKELMFDSEEEADHNFIKKEVFSESECEAEDGGPEETEVKRHILMEADESDGEADKLLDDEHRTAPNDTRTNGSNRSPMKSSQSPKSNNVSPLKPPPRRNLNSEQFINISPPALPPRSLKPVSKNYFKVSSVTNETTSNESSAPEPPGKPPAIEHSRKKSIQSNLNLLIDFDVLEEEEKLIEQLKENDIFNLNVINAQTQQLMLSSQMSAQLNGDSTAETIGVTLNGRNEPLLNDQSNITKIEVKCGSDCKPDDLSQLNLDAKLEELNLIELKLNGTTEPLESPIIAVERSLHSNGLELCAKQDEPSIESEQLVEIEPLIGQQFSLIQPLIASASEPADDRPRMKSKKIRITRPKVDSKECGMQTDAREIQMDLKLEKYRNFLVYDYAPNLKLTGKDGGPDLSMFVEPSIYGTGEERDSLFYQHLFKRNHNLSNPSLNQLATNPPTKTHSFESLYVTYDALYSKQNAGFFERHIVPRDANLSDVCLQVGDGLIKQTEDELETKRTELINEERVKLNEKKKPTMKDVAWTVDDSWQWQSSDEELTSSIAVNENISTKYRRYSCKYIIESGVESDSDGELNEDGLQSMLNDNVRLDGLNGLTVNGGNPNGSLNDHSVASNVKRKIEKTQSPPLMLSVDNEEPCSSGFFETSHRPIELKAPPPPPIELKQNDLPTTSNNLTPGNRERRTGGRRAKPGNRNEETEDEDDLMVFQEIGLDDVYTTNDELDDNQSIDRLEDEIYTVAARNLTYSTVARSISEYVFELYRLNDNLFAKSINNFILCTKELYEPNPLVIMRNIRQFINGIKNYLVKNGEKEFLDFVKHERKRLKAEEIIDLEAILTNCLHKLTIRPLKEFIYQRFVSMDFPFGYESYMKLSENMAFLATRLPAEFEIQNNVRLPNGKNMQRIAKFFVKLQSTYSPLKKLEYILSIVALVNFHTKIVDRQTIDGKLVVSKQRIDERTFVSVFAYLLVKFNVAKIEIEIDYIWSLLQPSLINFEADYYLYMVYSCVYVLKINFSICQERHYPLNSVELQRSMITSYLPSINDSLNAKCKLSLFQKEISNNLVLPKIIDHPHLDHLKNLKHSKKRNNTFNQNINELTLANSNFVQSYPSALNNQRVNDSFFRSHVQPNGQLSLKLSSLFTICCLKVLLLDELSGNICCRLIVVKPEMLCKEFCKLLAQKFAIFNSEDYSLFLLTKEGKDFLVDDNEIVFSIKVNAIKYGMNLSFVYKRTDSQYVFSNNFHELSHQLDPFGLI